MLLIQLTHMGMLYKITNSLIDTYMYIKPASFFKHSDPRTRRAQKLHQEHTQHHVLFHSFSLSMEPPSYYNFFLTLQPSSSRDD